MRLFWSQMAELICSPRKARSSCLFPLTQSLTTTSYCSTWNLTSVSGPTPRPMRMKDSSPSQIIWRGRWTSMRKNSKTYLSCSRKPPRTSSSALSRNVASSCTTSLKLPRLHRSRLKTSWVAIVVESKQLMTPFSLIEKAISTLLHTRARETLT